VSPPQPFKIGFGYKMTCHDEQVRVHHVEITTLQEYVDVIVKGTHKSGSLILQHPAESDETPSGMMAKVALGVARAILGDFSTWQLDAITPEVWAHLQSKMEATGWRVCVATMQHIHGVCEELSDRVVGVWLWQADDMPAGVCVKYVQQFGMFLWCVPLPE